MSPDACARTDERRVHPGRFTFVLPPTESYSAASGGAIATVTRQLARSLVASGHRVDVLTPDDGSGRYEEGDVHPLPFGPACPPPALLHKAYVAESRLRKWTWPEYGAYLRQVTRVVGQLGPQPDVVVVANDPEMAFRLHRRDGPRVVLWLHNRLGGREARRLRSLAGHVTLVAVSESVRRWTLEEYHLAPDSITVIHNAVDGEEFHPRPGFTEPRRSLRVVCHGRIDPNKGHEIAAMAVARLRRRGVQLSLTLIGETRTFGMPDEEVEAYVRLLDESVRDAGGEAMGRIPADQVAPVLREHDVACVLSKSAEPFCLSAIEAMASGCAVVTTGNGGIAELVGDSAVMVGTDDVAGVATALELLSSDPAMLADRKRAARARSEEFTWPGAAGALERITLGAGEQGA